MEKYTKRKAAVSGEGVPIPNEFIWAHLTLSLEMPPSELLALDQNALVLYDYHQGMRDGGAATREHAESQKGF